MTLDENLRAALAYSIQNFISLMWQEAERPAGSQANKMFREDGTFSIGTLVMAKGREGIAKVSQYREEIGPRVSRHVMSNYSFSFDSFEQNQHVGVHAVMMHFGGTGAQPLVLELPVGLYDVTASLERQKDGSWLIARWHMEPSFLRKDHPALAMPKSFSHPNTASTG
jgi:hypothetical protein